MFVAEYITAFRKARKESKDKITRVISVWSAREETIHEEGFQDGATFGYNKAKEEMQAQIEKMKCCFNCKHSRTECEHCRTDKHEKWEIKEND